MNRAEREWHDTELNRGVVDDAEDEPGEGEPSDPSGITPRDERLERMILANQEAERYAGAMERALERILTVCRLVRRQDEPLTASSMGDALDVIEGLATVRDDRRAIGRWFPELTPRAEPHE